MKDLDSKKMGGEKWYTYPCWSGAPLLLVLRDPVLLGVLHLSLVESLSSSIIIIFPKIKLPEKTPPPCFFPPSPKFM
jgi:hypothetical protein